MGAKEFRDRVLEILRREFPNEEFAVDDRAEVIAWKEAEFGLHSLHADAVRLGVTDEQLREAVVTHFDKVIKMAELGKLVVPSDWEVARERVRLVSSHASEQDVAAADWISDARGGMSKVRLRRSWK